MQCAWLWNYVSDQKQVVVVGRLTLSLSAMHKAWPELLKRMKAGKASASSKDRQLVVSSRTWFCLYLFEHQYVELLYRQQDNSHLLVGCHTVLAVLRF